jgi:WD40 repeat protein
LNLDPEAANYSSIELGSGNHSYSPNDADLSPDGSMLALSFPDGSVELWCLDGQQSVAVPPDSTHCNDTSMGLVRFLNASTYTTTCGWFVNAYSLNGTWQWSRNLRHESVIIESIDVSDDGRIVVARFARPEVAVWDTWTNQTLYLPLGEDWDRRVSISADGTVVGAQGQSARFFSIDVGNMSYEILADIPKHGEAVACKNTAAVAVGRDVYSSQGQRPITMLNLTTNLSSQVNSTPSNRTDFKVDSSYQSARLFASPNCFFVASISTFRWLVGAPNETLGAWSVPVIAISDTRSLNVTASFVAGTPGPEAPSRPSTLPNGSNWVVQVFPQDDGGAIAVSSNHWSASWYPGVAIWVTIALPSAVAPVFKSSDSLTVD